MTDGCAICRRRDAEGVQVLAHWLCRACLTAVGRLYRSGPPHVHARIWKESRADRLIRDELDALGREASLQSVEQTFAAFKKDLAGKVGPEDAETHCDLAIAYGELGLHGEAADEAAFALEHGTKLSSERVGLAAGLVLRPMALTQDLAATRETLRAVLYPD